MKKLLLLFFALSLFLASCGGSNEERFNHSKNWACW